MLEEIQKERALESEYNEEWDDWQGEGDEFVFSDPDGILDDIEEAIHVMHQCLDQERFDKGAELAQPLSELFVLVTGDYEDTMTLPELVANDLLKINLKKTVKEAVYLTCMGTPPAEHAEAMLAVLQNFREDSISLDEILQTGTKEIDLSSFLPSWIEALAKRPGNAAGTLLLEAQKMLQNKETALQMASRYAGSQPILYKRILEREAEKTDPKEMLQIGLRGMKEVPERHPVKRTLMLKKCKESDCIYRQLNDKKNSFHLKSRSTNQKLSFRKRWMNRDYCLIVLCRNILADRKIIMDKNR